MKDKIVISTGETTGIIVNTVKLKNKYMITQNDIFMTIKVLNDKIDQLTNNWNELEEWIKQRIDKVKYNSYDDVLDKMKEIQNGSEENDR